MALGWVESASVQHDASAWEMDVVDKVDEVDAVDGAENTRRLAKSPQSVRRWRVSRAMKALRGAVWVGAREKRPPWVSGRTPERVTLKRTVVSSFWAASGMSRGSGEYRCVRNDTILDFGF